MADIKALLVICNRVLTESETFRSLREIPGIDLLVADNSTRDQGNAALANAAGCRYFPMGENAGLSRAYNRVLDALAPDFQGLLCLFDDDTTVPAEYFQSLREADAANPRREVFIPLVRDNTGILSPCVIRGARVTRIRALQDLPAQGVSAINSGMAVRLRVFTRYRYDEGQFLDYIDHAFLHDVTGFQADRLVLLQNVTLFQRFSGSSRVEPRAAKKRYRLLRKDLRYFGKKYGVPWWNWGSVLLRRRLHLLWQGVW